MTSSFQVRHFILNKESCSITNKKNNQNRRIGTHDFLVLLELCKNAGSIVTKEQLLDKAWQGKVVADSSITQSISNIRTLIDDNGKEQKWLKTISKIGYILESEIVKTPDDASKQSSIDKNSDFSMLTIVMMIFSLTIVPVLSIKLYHDSNVRTKEIMLTLNNEESKCTDITDTFNLLKQQQNTIDSVQKDTISSTIFPKK
ncbi:transcriptional regulator [Vibrio sp. TBV020]|uniref:winged helix-turn-helix domain-containing protein n=1 Tax=Vibrio sp. TBV020 TaxID=3137398 RepID=UPI0038CD9C26